MSLIEKALASSTDTRAVVVGEGAVSQVAEMFKELFGTATAVVVGDERTMGVLGNRVVDLLKAADVPQLDPIVFPGEPELYAQYENCELTRDRLAGLDAIPVAVGAGTLNDIVKRAAGELERKYMVVCTAASMDGYTAFGASIALKGFKNTMNCPAPAGCIADITTLAAAPQVMSASGYGDLIGKVPAGADWIIADALGVEAIDDYVWGMVQGPLLDSLADPAGLAAGDIKATSDLAEGLIMSGLAMQAHQSSRPASGAEHQFSHLWEMEGHGVDVKPRRLSHGFKVAVGTVAIAALYEALFEQGLKFDIDQAVANWQSKEDLEASIRPRFTGNLEDAAVGQSLGKWIGPDEVRAQLTSLVDMWPSLTEKLKKQLLPATQLQDMLRLSGAPYHPKHIDVNLEYFKDTYYRAQMIRSRFTVLDIVVRAGLMDELVGTLFEPDGFWGKQPW